ncbi:replication protein [Salmonella enterica subsp. enterica serovar Falkensee]|nr:replication protein [Salmonella enterica]EDQ8565534.1 replication protein [Salmonella enterica subsp. enterica serovar Amager]EDT9765550.1 replication protein [Salmonella enterica subsp. enterica serovar Falkensee]EEQ0332538.1 replication protein [Salmonella enterica]HAU6729139.1 replication protein [Salmonella enterica subsp. enterica serovar Falkensee]
MSNLATVTQLRPTQRPVERRVAEIEDGFTRLANALYDELIGADLTKNQSKVAHAICRKTYGFGKKMDRISDSQLAMLTRLPRQKVNKAKNELIAMKVILREGVQIGPNKNIAEWQIEGCHYSGDNVTALVTKSVTKTVTTLSPKQGHTKETIQKKERKDKNTLPEQVQAEDKKPSPRHEETDKAFENIFWIAGMRKTGKKNAASAFRTQFAAWRKDTHGSAEDFARMLAEDIRCRAGTQFGFDRLHPATYLNGQRWNDEKPETITPQTKPSSAITVSKTGYVFFDR